MSPEMKMRWQCLDLAAKFTVGIEETVRAAARFEQFVHRGNGPSTAPTTETVGRPYAHGMPVWGPYTILREPR